MDLKAIGADLGLEEDEFIEIVELFLETAATDISRLKGAIETEDYDTLTEASHSLKGSAGNLGFHTIYTLSKEIEVYAREKRVDGLTGTLEAIQDHTVEIQKAVNAKIA